MSDVPIPPDEAEVPPGGWPAPPPSFPTQPPPAAGPGAGTPPRPPTVPPTVGPPIGPNTPTPRRRTWVWVLIGLGALALGGCGLLAIVGFALDEDLTDDLIAADFNSTASPFHVGPDEYYDYSRVDGTYVIRSIKEPDGYASTVGEYARTAYNVDTSMKVTRIDGAGSTAILGCFDEFNEGYEVEVGPDGFGINVVEEDSAELLDIQDTPTVPEVPFTLSMNCVQDDVSDDVTITGFLNGRRILQTKDPNGIGDWTGASIGFLPEAADQSMAVDNVVAHVPGG